MDDEQRDAVRWLHLFNRNTERGTEMPNQQTPRWWDQEWAQSIRRDQLEGGRGGDHDKPYEYSTPPTTGPKGWSKLLELIAKATNGVLGGEEDGDDE